MGIHLATTSCANHGKEVRRGDLEFVHLFKKVFSCYEPLKDTALLTDLPTDQLSEAGVVFDNRNDQSLR